jgi:hypothetical protein
LADEGPLSWFELKALDDLIGWCDRANFNQLDTGRESKVLHLYVVGALAGLASLAGEAVAGQPVHGGTLADEDASAVLAADQALVLEDLDGLASRPSR